MLQISSWMVGFGRVDEFKALGSVARLLTLATVLALALGPCSAALAVRPATSSAEADIRAVLDAQVAAWNRGDTAAFMEGYWNSPQTEFVGPTGITRGWQPVFDRYRKAYPDRAAMGHLDFSDLEIQVLAPDAALVVGHFHLQRQSDTPAGVFTLIFRKFPEGWRIIHDHTSQTTARNGS